MAHVEEITLTVSGYPPAKNEAKSLFAAEHIYADRVFHLLSALHDSVGHDSAPLFGARPLGLELLVASPTETPSDATNCLGGVADVLGARTQGSHLTHLGILSSVCLYESDRQIQEVHYTWSRRPRKQYTVTVWIRSAE